MDGTHLEGLQLQLQNAVGLMQVRKVTIRTSLIAAALLALLSAHTRFCTSGLGVVLGGRGKCGLSLTMVGTSSNATAEVVNWLVDDPLVLPEASDTKRCVQRSTQWAALGGTPYTPGAVADTGHRSPVS
jgi:hypothetical protein